MLFFLGMALIPAQQYSVSGVVVDFHDKTPLSNATVQLGGHTTTTNTKGEFQLKLKAGEYRLLAKHAECDDYQEEIKIQSDLFLKIILEHHVTEIETVKFHKKSRESGSVRVSTISNKELSRNATENLGSLVSNISGVSALKTGNNIAKPIIHGLYGDRVTVVNNGVKLADQEWGVEHAPNVDTNNFDHVDVVKGASALRFGMNASGGVVVLEPEIFPKKDTLKGKAKLSALSNGKGMTADLSLMKTWDNAWAVKTRGGYKKWGDLSTPNYKLMNTGMEMNSFGFTVQNSDFYKGFSVDYYLTHQKIGIFRGSDVGNLNDLYESILSQKPIYTRDFSYKIDNPHQEIQHHIAKISAYKRYENWGKFSVDYSFQYNNRKEFDLRRGELNNLAAMELELFTNQVNINNVIEREKWSLETGVNAQYQYNYSPITTQAKRLIPNYHQYNFGGYSVLKYSVLPALKTEVGIRYDHHNYRAKAWFDEKFWEENSAQNFSQFYKKTEGNRVFAIPNLSYDNFGLNAGVLWEISTNNQLGVSYSNTNRVPNVAELFANGLHHSSAMIEVGTMNLKNEKTQQVSLKMDTKINALDGLKLSLTPYFSEIKDFVTQVPTGIQNTIRGVFPVWTYQQVDAQMHGLDADLQWKFNSNLKWIAQFSYVYGQDKSNRQPLIMMMPMQLKNALDINVPWKKSFLRIEHQWVDQQKRYPVYNPTIKIFENGIEIEKILDLSTPPSGYQLWNLYAETELLSRLTLGLKVDNLLNKNYKNYMNRMRIFAHETGRNFILSVQYQF